MLINLNDLWNGSFSDSFLSGAFLMTFLNSLWSEVISEHFGIIDSVNGLVRKTMLHISSINSLEHISFISMEMLLLLVAKIYLKTVVITFLETSKLVGLITSGWNVTFWPSVNMQHWPARLQWDNLLGHPDHRAWHQCRVWRQIQILSCSKKSVSDTHKMKIKTNSCNHHMHRIFGYSHR